jgi:hypothetical protein
MLLVPLLGSGGSKPSLHARLIVHFALFIVSLIIIVDKSYTQTERIIWSIRTRPRKGEKDLLLFCFAYQKKKIDTRDLGEKSVTYRREAIIPA